MLIVATFWTPQAAAQERRNDGDTDTTRPRLIVETDAGGDPDDEQSMVRFLVYANEWDVEGIIANRPKVRDGENRNRIRDGLGVVRAMVEAYGACHARLVEHDPRFPTAEFLQQRTVSGYEESDDGVKLIIAAVDRDDPRPVWFLNWGTDNGAATSSLKRALDRVLAERGPEGYATFKNKLRLSSYDKFEEHTTKITPPWKLWVHTFQPEIDRQRWYHRFSAITATAGGFDIERDVRRDHGPLGAMYPTNTTHRQKEGDTMTFLYLVPTGMNDPNEPTWGSWAGRYASREDQPGKPYYWATAKDTLDGTTHRENTLKRWAADLQNDFRARMDWCVRPRDEANHPPSVVVNGKGGKVILRVAAKPGVTVKLSAAGTQDPDGNKLAFEWFNYVEAGTYAKAVVVDKADGESASVTIPRDAAGKSIHVVLTVTDDGQPPLVGYRRVVVDVAKK
ncbi:MAG: nucleoside hydrolase-like domain-containing protein [Pirellulales bacterium]